MILPAETGTGGEAVSALSGEDAALLNMCSAVCAVNIFLASPDTEGARCALAEVRAYGGAMPPTHLGEAAALLSAEGRNRLLQFALTLYTTHLRQP